MDKYEIILIWTNIKFGIKILDEIKLEYNILHIVYTYILNR